MLCERQMADELKLKAVRRRSNGMRLMCIKAQRILADKHKHGSFRCSAGLLLPQGRYLCSDQHAGLFVLRTLLTRNLDGRRTTRLRAADRTPASFTRLAGQMMRSLQYLTAFSAAFRCTMAFHLRLMCLNVPFLLTNIELDITSRC